ncbi:hypothetical protein KAFR_0I02030 [Kazachstania africana CBS 2517]|uniref:Zn(2)-C6 fungal-type domain-containing protein n=1 Tax=Kazachstania africana (strain ATCC 22294 / BCRC 22015 / CBS 2517 / CECT 1963 / NBRC 1671 / NRRL Y-8276) TaxID=1071382 RepID=H2B033_KAZAF|nr:hypothetical protein KAFR_0I02030 [Kazachstania africana CBS 2517]CCF59983.1 hypothetical protein KAFR_0I02030 [Kazachstania africana CBS 2517]
MDIQTSSSMQNIINNNNGNNRKPITKQKRKRNRIPLSCTICRKRKVKCDKIRPHCNQCTKTGVAHLCHYMEQSWAEEAEKELSKENEIKNLKERIKHLEKSLLKVSSNLNTPENISNTMSPLSNHSTVENLSSSANNNYKDKYDADELDLTKQFDMLHIKNNGTIHLGATHWLAIMKGDPYLKLLWSQIFSIREKVNEWYSKKTVLNRNKLVINSKNHHNKGTQQYTPNNNNNMNFTEAGLLAPHPLPVGSDGDIRKCPVAHRMRPDESLIAPHPLPVGSDGDIRKCPVAHNMKQEETLIAPHPLPVGSDGDIRKCPVAHKMRPEETLIAPHPLPVGSDGNIAKCPVAHKMNSEYPVIKKEEQISLKENISTDTSFSSSLTTDQIVKEIASMLPPKNIIFTFVDKFFKHIYPIVPIIDEHNFKSHLNKIILQDIRDSSKVNLNLRKASDNCLLGIMIIILRLTWLSLPPNRCNINLNNSSPDFINSLLISSNAATSASNSNMKDDNILIKFETSVEALNLTKDYLIKFDKISSVSNNNINLTTIQFAIFYKIYMLNAPNSSTEPNTRAQDNDSNQILLSSIIQMAFSCGLHRDPDNFPQLNVVSSSTSLKQQNEEEMQRENQISTERFKHTWRKVWFYIVHLDVNQSLAMGSPRLLRNLKDFSDTKLPSASKIDYVRDIKELIIIKNYSLFWQIDLVIVAVLNHILNILVAKNVRKFELDSLIKSLTDLTFTRKNISEVINDLINKGLLSASEGSINYQEYTDESYTLPNFQEILSNGNAVINAEEKKFELPHESTTKAILFTKHLSLRMLLFTLNYILFTHYEPMASQDSGTIPITKEYAQQSLNFAIDGFRNCLIFFNNIRKDLTATSTIFDYVNILLAPQVLDVGHRSLQFLVCLTLRCKLGPIMGVKESLFSGNDESDNDSINSEVTNNSVTITTIDNDELNENLLNDINLDNVNEGQLSETLIARMKIFLKLTKQIAVKYPYAHNTSRSVGFFITLLNKSSKKTVGDFSWRPQKISGFFKNAPSFVSADKDQLNKCPVYQDALGFMLPKMKPSTPQSTQLPPIRNSYKPITYTNSNIRKLEEQETNQELKKRKVDNEVERSNTTTPLPPLQSTIFSNVNEPMVNMMNDDLTNPNFNDLFDPNRIMEAITEFNPSIDMNEFDGFLNNSNNNNNGYNNNDSPNINNDVSRATTINSNGMNKNGNDGVELNIFVPKLEDGLTDFQDFTIWD